MEILSGPETWCRGWTARDGQAQCLFRALTQLHGGSAPGREVERLRHAMDLPAGNSMSGIAIWNDVPGRTWDEVAAVVEAYDRDRMLNP